MRSAHHVHKLCMNSLFCICDTLYAPMHSMYRDPQNSILEDETIRYLHIWVSQHRRLCSGANQPPLTHHPGCSPSAQAPSLSSSDNPIMKSPTGCPVMSFLSTLDGDAHVPSFGAQDRHVQHPTSVFLGKDRQGPLGNLQ